MAFQHFYSRVPARISMYNKFDGFDTFAHSAGLTREFIERELSIVYQDKLSKFDIPLVRKGEIKPVYYQCTSKSGKLVQGCITYLPLDYTGERSAYFTHSLVFTDEENNKILEDENNIVFNSEMFKTDISDFDITSPTATPNNNYPELDYVTSPLSNIQGIYKKYDPETVKCFIGAILLTLCKKGKNIYFKLDVSDDEASLYSLKLINEIMSILPFNLKQNLSFVTYINDYAQYSSFKLKCVSSKTPEIYQEKGVFIDFKVDLVTGLDLEEIRINKNEINFLYSLLENNDMRIEFLKFITNAIKNIPSLQNLNLKTLSDLIFLFCGTCGLFKESYIIPDDDSVFNFFCVYEKYRQVLSEEYRMRAYRVLKRYPLNHIGIPKTIFQKLTKLYPTDIKPAKRMAMDIVLELIHTDVMREKLFVFISNNYDEEDEQTKETINNDLCRVFYGGFMQPQILKFFTSNFPNEPITTQNQIIEKLFLTIRTVSIQPKIIEFIDMHYNIFTEDQKYKFYDTFFEMLVECDELAQYLVALTNKYVSDENDELKQYISVNLEKKLEADYRKKESLMLPILIKERGLCLNVVIKLIFKDWYQRKIYNHFIELLKLKDPILKTNILLDIITIVPNMETVVKEKLIQSITNIYENDYNKATLYTWIDLYNLITSSKQLKNNDVLKYVSNEEITKAIIFRLNDAFDPKLNPQGLDVIREFAKQNKKVKDSNNYQFISNYIELIGNIKINEISKAIDIYDTIPNDKKLKLSMANHLVSCVIDRKQSPLETIYFDILVSHLKDDKVQLDKLYIQYKELYKRQYLAKYGANANPKKATEEAISNALRLIFDSCYNICKSSSQLNEVICNLESKLRIGVQDLVTNYGNKTKKWIHGVTAHHEHTKFVTYFNQVVKECKPQGGKLFKLFKK